MTTKTSNFNDIYKANFTRVNRLCLGYTNGNIAQANDLTQEVFLKVWENLESFRNESNISTWVYRITVNTCLTYLRSFKNRKRADSIDDLKIESSSEISNNQDLKLKQLYSCIDKLNKDNKTIILLELEEVPQKEISKIMGLSHEAIRIRIHRIKNQLTKCVKQ